MLYFWPDSVDVTAPDGSRYSVQSVAYGLRGFGFDPVRSLPFIVLVGLPAHLFGIRQEKAWRVEVTDDATRRKNGWKLRPEPWITILFERRTKAEVEELTLRVAGFIQARGYDEQALLREIGSPT